MSQNHFTPHNIKISDIAIFTLWAFVAGVVWSVFLLIIVFVFSPVLEVQQHFQNTLVPVQNQSSFFPMIMSFFSFIASLIVAVSTYVFFCMSDPEKYKRTILHFSNICLFCLILYICMAPVYIFGGGWNYESILIIFVIHILLLFFGISFLLELLNNYRYILVWFYN